MDSSDLAVQELLGFSFGRLLCASAAHRGCIDQTRRCEICYLVAG
jgi:hypothetical protein